MSKNYKNRSAARRAYNNWRDDGGAPVIAQVRGQEHGVEVMRIMYCGIAIVRTHDSNIQEIPLSSFIFNQVRVSEALYGERGEK